MKTSENGEKKILIVEDEPSIGEVCKRVLSREGYDVELAVNGRVAQEMIPKQQYDLFLIDIRTPAMNGKELYRWLEAEFPDLAKRVIFTTGDLLAGDIKSFIEASGRPFLPKPFAPDDLIAIVKGQ